MMLGRLLRVADEDRAGGRNTMTRFALLDRATPYCACEEPVFDYDHAAACRRCGLPVDFATLFDPDEGRAAIKQ